MGSRPIASKAYSSRGSASGWPMASLRRCWSSVLPFWTFSKRRPASWAGLFDHALDCGRVGRRKLENSIAVLLVRGGSFSLANNGLVRAVG